MIKILSPLFVITIPSVIKIYTIFLETSSTGNNFNNSPPLTPKFKTSALFQPRFSVLKMPL